MFRYYYYYYYHQFFTNRKIAGRGNILGNLQN